MACAEPLHFRGKPKKRTRITPPPKGQKGPPSTAQSVGADASMLVPKPKSTPKDHPHGRQGKDKMRPLTVAKGMGLAALRKAAEHGEGSRGGKIIGHTRSGKPIYAATSSKYSKIRRGGPGTQVKTSLWNAKRARAAYPTFSVEDHDDAIKAHAKNYHHHDTEARHALDNGHRAAAVAHNDLADVHHNAWQAHKQANLNMRDEGHDYPPRAYHTASGGAEIHDAFHPAYAGMSNAVSASRKNGTIAYQNARAHNVGQIEQHFGHYTLADHKAAIEHHSDLASKNELAAEGKSPTGEVAKRRRERADFHNSVALAHSDAVEKQHGPPGSMRWLVGKSRSQANESARPLSALRKAAKRGEGSHGGHVVGHTRAGKPVYGHRVGVSQAMVDKDGALTGKRTSSGKWIHSPDAPHYRPVRDAYETPRLEHKAPDRNKAARAAIALHHDWTSDDHFDAAAHHLRAIDESYMPVNRQRHLDVAQAHQGAAYKLDQKEKQ